MSSRRLKAAGYFFLALGFLASGARPAYGWPWSKDMHRQPSIRPQEAPRVPPAHSIPRQGKEPRMDRIEAGKRLRNPLDPTPDVMTRGQRLYDVYCALCHGPDGKGMGPVAMKFVPPPDLTLDVFRKRPDGFVYQTIKDGGAIMPGQGEALSVEDRWAIVHYLKKLQAGEATTARTAK
jgi:mono/diheme cytochrome c family protein